MTSEQGETLSKVPAVTLIFWIIKILATTLGETGGDSFTMSFLGETTDNPNPNGYLIGTVIFAVVFFISVAVQIRAKRFHPFLYWFTIIATTTVGTTLADYVTRSVGLGYAGGSALLLSLVVASLFVWYRALGSVSVETVTEPKTEAFYSTDLKRLHVTKQPLVGCSPKKIEVGDQSSVSALSILHLRPDFARGMLHFDLLEQRLTCFL